MRVNRLVMVGRLPDAGGARPVGAAVSSAGGGRAIDSSGIEGMLSVGLEPWESTEEAEMVGEVMDAAVAPGCFTCTGRFCELIVMSGDWNVYSSGDKACLQEAGALKRGTCRCWCRSFSVRKKRDD